MSVIPMFGGSVHALGAGISGSAGGGVSLEDERFQSTWDLQAAPEGMNWKELWVLVVSLENWVR